MHRLDFHFDVYPNSVSGPGSLIDVRWLHFPESIFSKLMSTCELRSELKTNWELCIFRIIELGIDRSASFYSLVICTVGREKQKGSLFEKAKVLKDL